MVGRKSYLHYSQYYGEAGILYEQNQPLSRRVQWFPSLNIKNNQIVQIPIEWQCRCLICVESKREISWPRRIPLLPLLSLYRNKIDFSITDLNKFIVLYRKEAVEEILKGIEVICILFELILSVMTKSGKKNRLRYIIRWLPFLVDCSRGIWRFDGELCTSLWERVVPVDPLGWPSAQRKHLLYFWSRFTVSHSYKWLR